jgi:hypothetical protein
MKTLRCTCGEVMTGQTGAELYAAVEAHLDEHADEGLREAAGARAVTEETRFEEEVGR